MLNYQRVHMAKTMVFRTFSFVCTEYGTRNEKLQHVCTVCRLFSFTYFSLLFLRHFKHCPLKTPRGPFCLEPSHYIAEGKKESGKPRQDILKRNPRGCQVAIDPAESIHGSRVFINRRCVNHKAPFHSKNALSPWNSHVNSLRIIRKKWVWINTY